VIVQAFVLRGQGIIALSLSIAMKIFHRVQTGPIPNKFGIATGHHIFLGGGAPKLALGAKGIVVAGILKGSRNSGSGGLARPQATG